MEFKEFKELFFGPLRSNNNYLYKKLNIGNFDSFFYCKIP